MLNEDGSGPPRFHRASTQGSALSAREKGRAVSPIRGEESTTVPAVDGDGDRARDPRAALERVSA